MMTVVVATKLEYSEMKLATAAIVAASLVLAPLPSQAFFLNEQTINYKLHIVECLGLLLSDQHAAECGGKVTGPFESLASPGGPSGPVAAPVVVNPPSEIPDEKPCAAVDMRELLKGVPLGDSVAVATAEGYPCGPWEQSPDQ